MPPASLYIRLSREATDKNTSLEGMMRSCRELAQRLGLDVGAEHVDNGISGAVRDRPAFVAWLNDAREGRANVLLTFSADRLTREGVNAAALVLDAVEGKDSITGATVSTPVRLVSVDGIDSAGSDAWRFQFVIAAEVARAERMRIKERNQRARRELKAAERWTGGAVPYGCRVEIRNGLKFLTTDETEADVLREAASRILNGDGLHTVTRWLNGAGHRTRKTKSKPGGGEWIRSSLRATLTSKATADHVLDSSTRRELVKVLKPRDPSDKSKAAAKHSGGRPQTYLLVRGLAICGTCGGPLITRRDVSAGHTRYACSNSTEGKRCASGVSIDAPATDAAIEAAFLATYGDQHALELRTTIVAAADLEAAEKAEREAERAMREPGARADAFGAWQAARTALEAAQAKPLEIERQIFVSDLTYAQEWTAATIPKRAEMLRGALDRPVKVHPATTATHQTGTRGGVVDLDRLEVVWKSEVGDESQAQIDSHGPAEAEPPWTLDDDGALLVDGQPYASPTPTGTTEGI